MKLGWQLKEEAPLFLLVLIVVTGLMWYMGNPSTLSFGTGFLFAAVITSFEVIIDAAGHKRAEEAAKSARARAKKRKSTKKKSSKKSTKKKPKKKKSTKKKTGKKKTRKKKKK